MDFELKRIPTLYWLGWSEWLKKPIAKSPLGETHELFSSTESFEPKGIFERTTETRENPVKRNRRKGLKWKNLSCLSILNMLSYATKGEAYKPQINQANEYQYIQNWE